MVSHSSAVILALALLSASGLAVAGDPTKGKEGYQLHCEWCHGERGEGAMANAPDFTLGEGLLKTDPQLLKRIEDGKGACPSFWGLLERDEILNIVSYVRTLIQ